jgi:hypothetical protein
LQREGQSGASIATSDVPPPTVGAPTATAANNIYIAWNNNDTGHWNVSLLKVQTAEKHLERTSW